MESRLLVLAASCAALGAAAPMLVHAQTPATKTARAEPRFDIAGFELRGNTLLDAAQAQAVVAPYTGQSRVFADIEKAAAALEDAYRKAGFGAVRVFAPEQQVGQQAGQSTAKVLLIVTEARLGQVVVKGNKLFSVENVRRALPVLQEGVAPNLRRLSENVQLANESPARQVDVALGAGAGEDLVDATVNVSEEDLTKFIATLDNTGNSASGKYRMGVTVQSANIFDTDQTLTAAYSTSPDAPSGVKSGVYSLAWHAPFYGIGDSLDLIYGYSSSTTPLVQAGQTFVGKSTVVSLRWNHSFAREGEYSAKLTGGFDYQDIKSTCSSGRTDAEGALQASCLDYQQLPATLTYSAQIQGPERSLEYSASVAQNIPIGSRYWVNGVAGSSTDRYSFISSQGSTNTRRVPDDFNYLKGNVSLMQPVVGDWLARVALNWQLSGSPLPGAAQIGVAGSNSVRGFNERAVAGDSGGYVNIEGYTPELAGSVIPGLPGSLKALAFFDLGHARTYGLDSSLLQATVQPADTLASAGFGLRYSYAKNLSMKLDLADVTRPGNSGAQKRGDMTLHFALQLAY